MNFKQSSFIEINRHEEYQSKIVPLLDELATGKLSSNEILNTLRKFKILTSMTKQKNYKYHQDLTFKQLLKTYGKQMPQIFSKISKVVLQQKQKIKASILFSKIGKQVQFKKQQIVYLMSLMALNLVPCQQYHSQIKKKSRFPYTHDFSFIFQEELFKTKTIIQYFKDYFADQSQEKNLEIFSIRRQVLQQSISSIIDKNKNNSMSQYTIVSDQSSIQDYIGHAKVDFANKFIGGGALQSGCVQQEIMFANHPQLFTSVLFCQVMSENQALFFTGYRKYSKNIGYGWTTKYEEQEDLKYQKDQKNRSKQYIIAVDALHFGKMNDKQQSSKNLIDRELTKAYAGFNIPQEVDIITGNWGCGAFNGQVRLKFLIQWIACSLSKKKMVYCPFGKKTLIECNNVILNKLKEKKIGEVYKLLIEGGQSMTSSKQNIFQKISQLL